ncbi:CaiB/BaiF CoA transferase family protein [Micromonospora tulbaghiae]|uniref:Crotonobetainyl-CoA:carnitine CoA-transferase CaiB n=1 Tax=Micromonospora tulbaghiae TaxID=479978 RepID=A0ABY0KHW5_9ACTN|nr:CoA transferase [Micromonospora tulbaghiae]MDX5458319.1 CoA transferase [Micromonospora tulbaghiae]SCE74891.1 Crotonobetainyl-CoA:carnitine CoA-transferase CaiB [Micromonospora tulbaghiae]
MTGPLSGLRVLDLTSTFSGPYCTLMLADLGAEVIKVEPPGGDIARQLGAARTPGMAAVFLNMNRGKKSVLLDLKAPADRAAFDRLVPAVDVLVHNMRPAAAARLALTYDDVRALHPAIVYCAIPGFRGTSRHADRPAYDDVIQGASGIARLQSVNQEQPGYVVTPLADKITGLTASTAVLAALRHRDATGEGQRVEVPMFDTMVAFGLLEQLDGWTFDPPTGPPLYPRTAAPNRRPYATADGHLCVLIYTGRQWERFLTLVGRADLLSHPDYDTVGKRIANADGLYRVVAEVLRRRTTAEWLAELSAIDVPCAPLAGYEEILREEERDGSGLVSIVEHPVAGRLRSIASPIAMSASPLRAGRLAPTLGEHNDEVLAGGGTEGSSG